MDGDRTISLHLFRKSLALSARQGDALGQSTCLEGIADVLMDMDDAKSAATYYAQALEHREQGGPDHDPQRVTRHLQLLRSKLARAKAQVPARRVALFCCLRRSPARLPGCLRARPPARCPHPPTPWSHGHHAPQMLENSTDADGVGARCGDDDADVGDFLWRGSDGLGLGGFSNDADVDVDELAAGDGGVGPHAPASESSTNLDYLQQRLASAMTTGAVALTKLWS